MSWNDTSGDGVWESDVGAATGFGEDFTGAKAAGATDSHGCRHCGESGHLARMCPTAPAEGKQGSECFNCGQEGHNKADCPNERVVRPFTGTCRTCQAEGHTAKDCPSKPPVLCHNCKLEGHVAKDCTARRALDWAGVEDMSPEEAWDALMAADKERDLDDVRQALKAYSKSLPGATLLELELAFRKNNFNTYLIAKKKEVFNTQTLVNLQGKLDCSYEVGFYFGEKPMRKTAREGWPADPADNLERLKDAGFAMDRGIPKCSRCDEVGHTTRECKEEAVEIDRVKVQCVNCSEVGHRARDCTKARYDRFACRNCKQSGHQASECTEPRSAADVECKKCSQMGHFAKDCDKPDLCRNCGEEGHHSRECEKPRNAANVTCRNCETLGHFSKDCPLPRDFSKVKCNNCGEMGHTIKRCKAEIKDDNVMSDGGFGGASGGGVTIGDATVAPTGNWDTPGGSNDWEGAGADSQGGAW